MRAYYLNHVVPATHNADIFVLSGSSWAKMPLLTIGLLGAQIVWSTEMGYGEPLSTLESMVGSL